MQCVKQCARSGFSITGVSSKSVIIILMINFLLHLDAIDSFMQGFDLSRKQR